MHMYARWRMGSHSISWSDNRPLSTPMPLKRMEGGWMKKCISFGADGASVNMGHRGGVIAHLQREAGEHIIPIHCMPHRLELAILTIQKKEPKVSVVYDLLNLIWKTYHFSGQSKRELCVLGQELGVDICTLSSVKGPRWIPHVHRAFKLFLWHGQNKDLATDEGQYSVVLQHTEHLAVASTTAEVQGRAKKIKREMGMHSFVYSAIFFQTCLRSYPQLASPCKGMA
ncbi:zinc finger protein 862-like isoform 2-T2 [Salvelinus alpinus]